MKKKLLSRVLSAVLLLALLTGMAFPALAAASVTLSVADVQAYPGDSVVVNVSLNGVTSGLQITLEYDSAVLTPEKIVKGPQCPSGWMDVSSNDLTMGRFIAASGSLKNEAIDGVVVQYTYKVNPSAALGKSSLSVVTAIMSDVGADFGATVSSHGSVTVVSSATGPAVNSVTITPKTADVKKGSECQFSATVNALGGAASTVNWTVNSAVSTIDPTGKLAVAAGETLNELEITATSTFDNTKSDTAKVTVKPAGDTDNTGGPSGSSGSSGSGGEDIGDTTTPGSALFPFTDVKENDWFYGDVYYMWENNLMNGTSSTLFSPNSPLTRGMVVTVLYRMESEPDVTELDNPFSDVAAGKYYTNAVIWAADNEIVRGYGNGTYLPDRNVTREEIAAILYRYEQYTEKIPPTDPDTEERVFADAGNISDYAKEPVKALVMQGIINGKPDNKFDPKGNATRAEYAAMLHRYMDAISG